MSAGWPRNVIVAKREAAPLASRCETLPIGNEYRFVNGPAELPERVFTCLGAIHLTGLAQFGPTPRSARRWTVHPRGMSPCLRRPWRGCLGCGVDYHHRVLYGTNHRKGDSTVTMLHVEWISAGRGSTSV